MTKKLLITGIAGFIGACSLYFVLLIHKLPTNMDTTFSFMIVAFVVSALYGFLMKFSGLQATSLVGDNRVPHPY